MNEAFNQLSPAEAERLALLMEECAEVQQDIGKILRHGYESCHPNGGDNNRMNLQAELGDLRHAVDRMIEADDVDGETIEFFAEAKALRIGQYLHHQPPQRTGEE